MSHTVCPVSPVQSATSILCRSTYVCRSFFALGHGLVVIVALVPAMVRPWSRSGHGMATGWPAGRRSTLKIGWMAGASVGRMGGRDDRCTSSAPHAPRSTSPLRPTPTLPPSGGHGDTGTPRRSPHAHHPHTHPNPTHRLPVQTDVPPLPHSQKPSQKPAKASKKLAKTGRRTQPSPS